MKVTWYGTASLSVSTKYALICFDPFCKMKYSLRLEPTRELSAMVDSASAIFVTHGHFDHILDIPRLLSNNSVKVYCTKAPSLSLKNDNLKADRICEITPGFNAIFSDISIKAFQGKHCKFDVGILMKTLFSMNSIKHAISMLKLLSINSKYKENNEILFYELESGGKRLQIMGSMNLSDDVLYPCGADILILPFQGRSDQNKYALQFIEKLKPKRVLLDHYDNAFPPMSSDVDTVQFCESITKIYGIPCEAMSEYVDYYL